MAKAWVTSSSRFPGHSPLDARQEAPPGSPRTPRFPDRSDSAVGDREPERQRSEPWMKVSRGMGGAAVSGRRSPGYFVGAGGRWGWFVRGFEVDTSLPEIYGGLACRRAPVGVVGGRREGGDRGPPNRAGRVDDSGGSTVCHQRGKVAASSRSPIPLRGWESVLTFNVKSLLLVGRAVGCR